MSRVLGVDYGSKRVGLAISDALGLVAHPLRVVPRDRAVEEISRLVRDEEVTSVVLGLPTSLSGGEGPSAEQARRLGEEIATAAEVEVILVDERFTTRLADAALLDRGVKRGDRRRRVDKVAAAIILQEYLDRR